MDVDFRASAVALGAALFNAKVAAAAHQVLGPVTLTEEAGEQLQATLRLGEGGDLDLAGLYQPMLARETNRTKGTPTPIADNTIELMDAVAEREGAVLHLLTARDEIAQAAVLLAAADRTRYLTPRLHAEMTSELRWPGDPSPDTGIDVRSLELDPGDLAVLDVLRRPDVVVHLARWNAGTALGEYVRERVLDSSALAVITVPGDALTDHARGGSAAEAVWITAQQHGLAVQPISPVFLYAHGVGDLDVLSTTFANELGQLQKEFRELAHVRHGESMVLVLRFAAGGPTSVRSRRSFDRVRLIAG
jgi:hypothetical protein